ncbi:MAG: lectin like domain-containing protein [Bacillota bacterium]|nr:lectin like domain-containing protein [Bacillota bacterium]
MRTKIALSVFLTIALSYFNIDVIPLDTPLKYSSLPTFYSTYETLDRDLFIRNQGTANTCWAFAANSLLEIYLLKNHGTLENFSETHMIENSPIPTSALSGGRFNIAMGYFLNRLGPIDENGIQNYYVKSYVQANDDMNLTKQLIKKHGAVVTSIFYDISRSGFFSEDTSSYFNPSRSNPITHDVILIGWDDYYDRNNFRSKPQRNGAFIAQNSFGNDWGQHGLFYISYEDVHVLDTNYAIDSIEPMTQNSKVYFYDETGVTHFEGFPEIEEIYGINNFVSSYTGTDQVEYLTGIGIYTSEPDTNVTLFADATKFDPKNTDLNVQVGQTTFDLPGYHRYDLETPLELIGGAPFYIGAKVSGSGPFVFPIEAPYPGMDYEVFASENEGYIGSNFSTGEYYSIFEFRNQGSLAIRAYTVTK